MEPFFLLSLLWFIITKVYQSRHLKNEQLIFVMMNVCMLLTVISRCNSSFLVHMFVFLFHLLATITYNHWFDINVYHILFQQKPNSIIYNCNLYKSSFEIYISIIKMQFIRGKPFFLIIWYVSNQILYV